MQLNQHALLRLQVADCLVFLVVVVAHLEVLLQLVVLLAQLVDLVLLLLHSVDQNLPLLVAAPGGLNWGIYLI